MNPVQVPSTESTQHIQESDQTKPTIETPPDLGKKPKRTYKAIHFIIGCLILITLISIGATVLWFSMGLVAVRPDVPVNGEVVEVKESSSLEDIASQLAAKDLISDKTVFILYAKFGPAHGKLQPGPYLIKPTSNIKQIVSNMAAGKIAISKITFPEGITINEMAKRFAAAGYGTKDEYLSAVKKLAPEFGFVPTFAQDNPEGYLFPATYSFTINSPADVLVRQQYEAFATNISPLIKANRPANLIEHEVLTLASVVEKEALTTKDRKLTAGVFLNRLALGMKLESDVTVNYTTGKTQTTPGDIAIASAYNTYKIRGLPPTPIDNPGTESVEAVMNPTKSDYIFFLAGKDGVVYYAKTLPEHDQNIKNHL
ncbi:endolytic transglycosylase MltG [Candidatus Saccharibacteria bacterium]|nr:endolytic transglycosylase MltG [Candidatus Saccharibacteria bacterium]